MIIAVAVKATPDRLCLAKFYNITILSFYNFAIIICKFLSDNSSYCFKLPLD